MKQILVKQTEIRSTARTGLYEEYINHMSPLEKTISEMRAMAKRLVPHTWPLAEFEEEQDVLCLKQRLITIDGYRINVCLSRADYGNHFLDSLQVQPYHGPFLPFNVVCKLGKAFLGHGLLSYIDFFKSDKKVYCWAIKHVEGRLLPPSERSNPAEFEGYRFQVLHPGTVDLF